MSVNVNEIMELVGQPKSYWMGENFWVPARDSKYFTPEEFFDIFSQECTLFVGDSVQRRAAGQLNRLLQMSVTDTHVFDRGELRKLDEVPKDCPSDSNVNCLHRFFSRNALGMNGQRLGCVDSEWAHCLHKIEDFGRNYWEKYGLNGNYSILVIGYPIWHAFSYCIGQQTPQKIRELVNQTIYSLYQNILLPSPSSNHSSRSPLIVWKTSGWIANCGWTPNETALIACDNYMAYAGNDEAKKVISHLNHPNLILVDWSREILPRSFYPNKIRPEDGSHVHYGLNARIQFLQLLAHAVYLHKQNATTSKNATSILSSKTEASKQYHIKMINSPVLTTWMAVFIVYGLAIARKRVRTTTNKNLN